MIAGVDEVGRGCLAGPVTAAAAIIPEDCQAIRLDDSKKLTAKAREKAYFFLVQNAKFGVGFASVAEIDSIGIQKASILAMERAIRQLPVVPDEIWVDGTVAPDVDMPVSTFIKGDSLHKNISAASILAKVLRDQWMKTMHPHFPEYGFDAHKGYGTKQHLRALKDYGPCRLHRYSFAPVRQAAENE